MLIFFSFFCYKLTRSVHFSSMWLSVKERISLNRSRVFHVMHFTFTCFAIFAGRDFHESIELHRNKADIAHLIILLKLKLMRDAFLVVPQYCY